MLKSLENHKLEHSPTLNTVLMVENTLMEMENSIITIAELKIEKSILNAVNKKVDLIKLNIHYGDPISKNLIPMEYIEKYGITNLFRVELPNFWRMLYTLTNSES